MEYLIGALAGMALVLVFWYIRDALVNSLRDNLHIMEYRYEKLDSYYQGFLDGASISLNCVLEHKKFSSEVDKAIEKYKEKL